MIIVLTQLQFSHHTCCRTWRVPHVDTCFDRMWQVAYAAGSIQGSRHTRSTQLKKYFIYVQDLGGPPLGPQYQDPWQYYQITSMVRAVLFLPGQQFFYTYLVTKVPRLFRFYFPVFLIKGADSNQSFSRSFNFSVLFWFCFSRGTQKRQILEVFGREGFFFFFG